jgi:uncharacterized protein
MPRTQPDATEWYADGLRFACTQCGNCCTGPPGAVWFSEAEGRAMAAKLGLSEPEFYERYARRIERFDLQPDSDDPAAAEGAPVPTAWSLRERRTKHGYDCIFLDRERIPGKAICSLYEARPAQCRTWPFWPENLQSKRAWVTAKKLTPCPGMDSGKLVPIEQIRIQRDATPR